MGFLDKFISGVAKNTYRGICKAMIDSYNRVKQQNPRASKRELYALALSLRPTYQREESSSFTFTKRRHELTIKEEDDLKEVTMRVIIIETLPFDKNPNLKFVIDTFMNMPAASELLLDTNIIEGMLPFGTNKNFITTTLKEISESLEEEFKDFKE